MSNSKRKCAMCKERFKTDTGLIRGPLFFCSPDHLVDYASANVKALANKQRDKQVREFKKETARRKKDLLENDRSHQLKLTQKEFNAWIRFRDEGKPCISCGRLTGCKMNAGHFMSVGSSPALRFHPLNCSVQCESCNSYKSGNIGEYRPRLIEKIGLDKVEWLEGPHEPKKYTCEQLREIRAYYARLTREGIKDDSDRPYP